MKIKKLMKRIKASRNLDVALLLAEMRDISRLMRESPDVMRSSYNLHHVPVGGVRYMVADARILNKAINQSGRGNIRYLIDNQSRQVVGVAQELDTGKYRRVA